MQISFQNVVIVLDMDGTSDTPYALDYSESMAFFNSAYNPTSAQSITATEFDSAQELLWAGSNEVLPCDEEITKENNEDLRFRDEWLRSMDVNFGNIRDFVCRQRRIFEVFCPLQKDR